MKKIPKVLVINYGIEGDPHAYFLTDEDDDLSIWEVIKKRQLFDLYSFFEQHTLVNGTSNISLETLIKNVNFELVDIHNEETGEESQALAIELTCQKIEV